jgi:ribosomal protein L16/L10AE
MLMPKKVKHRKQLRGRMTGMAVRGSERFKLVNNVRPNRRLLNSGYEYKCLEGKRKRKRLSR